MPIYEYQCQKCKEVSEYWQSMSEAPKTACELCGGTLERLISRSAFHLKGGGWYKDLYSSSGGNSSGKSTSSGGASSGSSSSSDSKPSSSPSSTSGTAGSK